MGRPRLPLISRRKAAEAALGIIDQEGLDKLSIRRLGAALNVRGISLYHHFRDKDEILVAACEVAFENIRMQIDADRDWRDWLVASCAEYWKALMAHPNLIPVLMRRHPMRLGIDKHNASAGLLAVRSVPPGVILPLLEGMESLALGSAAYASAVDADDQSELWRAKFHYLHHVNESRALTREQVFQVSARATLDAILAEYEGQSGQSMPART